MTKKTNKAEVIRALNAALPLQYQCALGFAIAAGTLPGPQGVALSERLRGWAAEELIDVERTAARIAALGGKPSATVSELRAPTTLKATLTWLVGAQREALDAYAAAIPADADDAEGEATEHLLEHIIMRKRDVLENLERAQR